MESKFGQVEFADDNTEPRCAVVLLLDTSGSMDGQPIMQLNDGLRVFEESLKADKLASLRVEIAVLAFGGSIRAINPKSGSSQEVFLNANDAFVVAGDFKAPQLVASGDTPMGGAILQALSLLGDRKGIYKANGIDAYRPWIFLITDGKPTDTGWEAVPKVVVDAEDAKKMVFYAVGVEGADMQTLALFSTKRPPLKLKGLAFREMFVWLSGSLSTVSRSRVGDMVPLKPVDWGSIDTSQ